MTDQPKPSTESPPTSNEWVEPEIVSHAAMQPVRWPEKVIRFDFWLHSIFAIVCAAIILASVLMRQEGEHDVYLPWSDQPMAETCSAKRFLGIECPACGLTRAFVAIGHGQFDRAWRFNSASLLLYFFIAIQPVWHVLQIIQLRKRGRAWVIPYLYLLPVGIAGTLIIRWLWLLATA